MKLFIQLSIQLSLVLVGLIFGIQYQKKCNTPNWSMYTTDDILHINYEELIVTFEMQADTFSFKSEKELHKYLESVSANFSHIHGYADDLDYQIKKGHVFAQTVHNEDEQYTELLYQGPHWGTDATKDTAYVISTFNHVEKLYDPVTKSILYESYCID